MKRKYVQGILFGVLFATAVSCSACGGKRDEAKKSGETVNAKENVVKKKEAVNLFLVKQNHCLTKSKMLSLVQQIKKLRQSQKME